VRRNDELSVEEIEALAPERIVISPGPCTPTEAGVSVDVIRRAGADHARSWACAWGTSPSARRTGATW
jgi:anthranilate/para-aminobenzoate synthase component II